MGGETLIKRKGQKMMVSKLKEIKGGRPHSLPETSENMHVYISKRKHAVLICSIKTAPISRSR